MTDKLLSRIQALMESAMGDAERHYASCSMAKAAESLVVLASATEAYLKLTQVAAVVFLVNKPSSQT